MALDPIVLDADPMPALAAKVNANFARLGLAGAGAPALPADFLGQEYLDTASGAIHVARAIGSSPPGEDWEPKLRSGEKGAPNGCASLDGGGRVPAAQLPPASGGVLNHALAVGAPATSLGSAEALVGTVSLTPAHATSPVLILARADLTKDGGTTARLATLTLRRGVEPTAPGVGLPCLTRSQPLASTQYGPLLVLGLDRPDTTAAVTYGLFAKVGAGKSTADRFELVAVELTGAIGPEGPAGADGRSLRSGAGVPEAELGVDGDLYVDTTAGALYGPKTAGGWGAPTSLVGPMGPPGPQGSAGSPGPMGPAGPAGPQGAMGRDGRTILSGSGAPAAALGAEGDFYLDRAVTALYGPKAAGVWGAPTSLIGPAGPPGTGGSGGLYAGQRTIAGAGLVTGADRARLIRVTGAAATVDLAAAGFAELDWIEIRNDNPPDAADGIVTLAAGADGIDEAGRESVLLAPGDTVRLVKAAAGSPAWLTLSPIGFLALGANQHAAADDAGAAQEARTDRHAFTVDIVDPTGDGAHGGFRAAWPGRLEAVHGRARAGTAALTVLRNGVPISAFATPVALGTTETAIAASDSFTTGDYITYRLTTTNGLASDGYGRKGAYVTAVAVRTGD